MCVGLTWAGSVLEKERGTGWNGKFRRLLRETSSVCLQATPSRDQKKLTVLWIVWKWDGNMTDGSCQLCTAKLLIVVVFLPK